mmetsp:Transcript_6375/g.18342  ORF Transcript_6375/g.18342 Transcript_6375/m.18342 type:complete len:249 (-) Transcript_6375:512-1258(-)
MENSIHWLVDTRVEATLVKSMHGMSRLNDTLLSTVAVSAGRCPRLSSHPTARHTSSSFQLAAAAAPSTPLCSHPCTAAAAGCRLGGRSESKEAPAAGAAGRKGKYAATAASTPLNRTATACAAAVDEARAADRPAAAAPAAPAADLATVVCARRWEGCPASPPGALLLQCWKLPARPARLLLRLWLTSVRPMTLLTAGLCGPRAIKSGACMPRMNAPALLLWARWMPLGLCCPEEGRDSPRPDVRAVL